MSDYGLKYIASFDSEVAKHDYEIRIMERDFAGNSERRNLGGAPVLIKDENWPICGTSIEFQLETKYDGDLREFYTEDNKKFRVEVWRNSILIWKGLVVTEAYAEDMIPCSDILIRATDGLGLLKNEPFKLTGKCSLLSIIKYCTDKTELYFGYDIRVGIYSIESPVIKKSFLDAQVYPEILWEQENCYEALVALLNTFAMSITQESCSWVLRQRTIATNFYRYDENLKFIDTKGIDTISIGRLGQEGANSIPLDSLTFEVEPSRKAVEIIDIQKTFPSILWDYDFGLQQYWKGDGRYLKIDGKNCYHIPNFYKDFWLTHRLEQKITLIPQDNSVYFEMKYALFTDRDDRDCKLMVTIFINDKSNDSNLYWLSPQGWQSASIPATNDKRLIFTAGELTTSANHVKWNTLRIDFDAFPQTTHTASLGVGIYNVNCGENINSDSIGLYVSEVRMMYNIPEEVKEVISLSPGASRDESNKLVFSDRIGNNDIYDKYGDHKGIKASGMFEYADSWHLANVPSFRSFYKNMCQVYANLHAKPLRKITGTLILLESVTGIFECDFIYLYDGKKYFALSGSYNLLADEIDIELIEVNEFVELDLGTTYNAPRVIDTAGSVVRGASGVEYRTYSNTPNSGLQPRMIRELDDETNVSEDSYIEVDDGVADNSKKIPLRDTRKAILSGWFYENEGQLFCKLPFVGEHEITAYGSGTTGGGNSLTLGSLENVGAWADEIPTVDRIMVQLSGTTHWASKPLSEIVGLDTTALAEYLVSNKYTTQEWVDTKVRGYLPIDGLTGMTGSLKTAQYAGSWIQGKSGASIMYNNYTPIRASSYEVLYGMKSMSGHVLTFGGIGDQIGFYGYKSNRTENGTDYSFYCNTTNGAWGMSGPFNANGGLYLLNNIAIYGQTKSGASHKHIAYVDVNDRVLLGDPSTRMLMMSNNALFRRNNSGSEYQIWDSQYFDPNTKLTVSNGVVNLTRIDIPKTNSSDKISIQCYQARLSFSTNSLASGVGVNANNLLLSNAWADASRVPVYGMYSSGAIHTNSGYYVQNEAIESLVLPYTLFPRTKMWRLDSFTTATTSTPGADPNSSYIIDDGFVLTTYWGPSHANQIVVDADGTGMAYRKYDPNTGNNYGWKFLATTEWVRSVLCDKKLITVGGDPNTYYPVVISGLSRKEIPSVVTIYKDLGSTTPPSWVGNHSNGTSSCLYRYEFRNTSWDGNGGYIKTLHAWYGYAPVCANVTGSDGVNGSLVIWLRGGGASYYLSCNNSFSYSIYYERSNLYTEVYPEWVEPRTTIGNGGKLSTVVLGFGDIAGNATTATNVVWSGVTDKPNLAILNLNSYWGLPSDNSGGASSYIRTPLAGIIPYSQNAGAGVSSVGTPGWPFESVHANTLYGKVMAGGVAGSSWGYGFGGLNVSCKNDTGQSPLIVAYRDGSAASVNGATRLFSMELLNAGTTLNYLFASSAKFGFTSTGNFRASGEITAYSTSDRRLKENIQPLKERASDLLRLLRPVCFNWNKEALLLNPSKPKYDISFIADEYEKVFPFACGKVYGKYTGIDKSVLFAVLTAGWQEHDDKICRLERRVKELENEIQRLTA